MSEHRHTADTITDDELDRLYTKITVAEQATAGQHTLKWYADDAQRRVKVQRERAEQAEADRDGAYRERAHVVALLAAMTDGAVIAPALDIDEPGWWIAYLKIGGRQASWHIAPTDAGLFRGVERVEPDDPRAQWDGHTTDLKYTRIRHHTRIREMNRRLTRGKEQRLAELATAAAPLICCDDRHQTKVAALEARRDQLAAALREALAAFNSTAREPDGRALGHYAEAPIHPDDMACWRAVLDQTKEQPMPATDTACTATIEGPHVLGGGPIRCTRKASHTDTHIGPNPEGDGKTLWGDHNAGATPHQASSEE